MRLWAVGEPRGLDQTVVGRITRRPVPAPDRNSYIPSGSGKDLAGFAGDWTGYAGVVCTDKLGSLDPAPPRAVYSPPNLALNDGDVVALGRDGSVRIWYRRASENNTILLTEQCNSYCLMCSQPPKERDDSDRIPLILRLLELIDPRANGLVLSGGEPTLLGNGFLEIVQHAKDWLPTTGLHILTNGRRFSDADLARRLAMIRHEDLVLGIPLYSDIDWRHDHVVQAQGAYDETLLGFYNLAAVGIRLELRVVIHQQTADRLPDLARFIARNLPFVEHVALMGLEMYGFTPRNLDVLWIDPLDYSDSLSEATRILALNGMNVSIYNHQLCTIPRAAWPFARKSISDWKNIYLPQCDGCSVREFCGGFFQSATKQHSIGIAPVVPLAARTRQAMNEIFGAPDMEPPHIT